MTTLSDVQINAIKYLIYMSRNAGEESKRICFALIDASEKFTKPVYYTSNSKDGEIGVDCMVSSAGQTHLQEILKAMGVDFCFSHCGGYFAPETGFVERLKPGERYTHTSWLSKKRYDRDAIEISQEEVEEMELKNSLY